MKGETWQRSKSDLHQLLLRFPGIPEQDLLEFPNSVTANALISSPWKHTRARK